MWRDLALALGIASEREEVFCYLHQEETHKVEEEECAICLMKLSQDTERQMASSETVDEEVNSTIQ